MADPDADAPLTPMEFAILAVVAKRGDQCVIRSDYRDKFLALGFIELGPNGVLITSAGRARLAKGQ